MKHEELDEKKLPTLSAYLTAFEEEFDVKDLAEAENTADSLELALAEFCAKVPHDVYYHVVRSMIDNVPDALDAILPDFEYPES